MELDEEREMVAVRFFGKGVGYPGIEREYKFSDDAFVVRQSQGEMVTCIARWLSKGEHPK